MRRVDLFGVSEQERAGRKRTRAQFKDAIRVAGFLKPHGPHDVMTQGWLRHYAALPYGHAGALRRTRWAEHMAWAAHGRGLAGLRDLVKGYIIKAGQIREGGMLTLPGDEGVAHAAP